MDCPATSGQAGPDTKPGDDVHPLVQARRYLQDLVAFEGRRFILPEETVPHGPAAEPQPQPEIVEVGAQTLRIQNLETPGSAAPVAPARDPVRDGGDDVVAGGADDGADGGASRLEAFRQTICTCMACPLGQSRQQFVFGAGNPAADIVFVGEAPGADEDRQGEPFVGAAGQLLTRIIEAVKLRRQNVYICNVLKCRPPGNRDPTPDEVATCEPYLQRQIDIIRPRLICALGLHAAHCLLKVGGPMRELRGRLHDYRGTPVIVTYHPAALLRDNRYKRATWEDMKWLRREYDGLEL